MREDTSRLWNADGSVHSQEKGTTDQLYTMEQLPCLAVTAANFICLLLRDQGTKAISLHEISVRLLCAKTIKVRKEEDRNQVDVNRRIYDVVSVLATFNVVKISLDPSQKHTKGNRFGDKHLLRKHVMFNYALFNDQRQIKIADYSAKQLRNHLNEEKHDRLPKQLFKTTYSHRTVKWHNDFDRPASSLWEFDSTKQRYTAYGCNRFDAKRTLSAALAYPKNQTHTLLTRSPWLRKRYRRMKNTVSSSDLCPLPSVSPEIEEEAWWSESLKPLLFFGDVTIEGKLPRNTSNMSTHKKEIWGSDAFINGISRRKKQATRRLFDLYCHEVLDEPSDENTTQDWLKWLG
uniref:AlNc14C22G2296 protein n=1 Tax=Albugo laibachii Nc14 TaxID=890382 RepID=F0W5Y8_9STRA|nr:AlNc14C22G2296 [Albugo laibachii Nc14]|eukprot:CCA16529.1 AlNc14C22G2296 [Albugo laibachii Nc14]